MRNWLLGLGLGMGSLALPWTELADVSRLSGIAAVGATLGLLSRGVRGGAMAALSSGMLMGYAWGVVATSHQLANRLPECAQERPERLLVLVERQPAPLSGSGPGGVRVQALVVEHEQPGCSNLVGKRLRLSWYGAPPVTAGQSWWVTAKLRVAWGYRNPGGFDHARWMLGQGLDGSGYVLRGEIAGTPTGGGLGAWQASLRTHLDDLDLHGAGVVYALATGDGSLIDGPTGVGKTELCKALAQVLFDSEDALVRVDMSEFMEKHSVARLIGAPPGYVGYEAGGFLTERIRRRPYSLILLDEIEKAHADVFNILLQVLDDGRLTDGHGRTVDFRNCVLVMTSNLGSEAIQSLTESGNTGRIKETVMGVVAQHFRPEFLNRVDDSVVFHPLALEHVGKIAEIQFDILRGRLGEQDLDITLSEAASTALVTEGYDPVYGARPLKRVIQRRVENPLATKLLAGEFGPGDVIDVQFGDGLFLFHKSQQKLEQSDAAVGAG